MRSVLSAGLLFVITAAAYLEYVGSEPRVVSEDVRASIAEAYTALCQRRGSAARGHLRFHDVWQYHSGTAGPV